MPLPRTPIISYMYGGTQPQQTIQRDNRDADIGNKPADNKPVTQLNQDTRPVYNSEQGDNNAQNTWRQTETERWGTRLPVPADNKPVTPFNQDNRPVYNFEQGDNNAQNTRRQTETERWGTMIPVPETRPQTGSDQPLSAHGQVRRGVNLIDGRADELDRSVEKLETDWKEVPGRVEGVESAMAAGGPQIDELNRTRVNHSARIDALEQEVRNVKIQNAALKEELARRGELEERMFRNGQDSMNQRAEPTSDKYTNERQDYYGQGQGQNQGYGQGQGQGYGQSQGYEQNPALVYRQSYGIPADGQGYGYHDAPRGTNAGDYQQQNANVGSYQQQNANAGGYQQQNANAQQGRGGRRENEQYKNVHAAGDRYLGMKQFYNPELMTAYRREQATFKIATTGGLGEVIHRTLFPFMTSADFGKLR